MWRPETTREKEAREHPKAIVEPIGNKFTTQVTQNPIEPGSCCDILQKVVQYVVCCCGCCTSWDTYFGHPNIDWDAPGD